MTTPGAEPVVRKTIESTAGSGMVIAAFPATGKTWLTTRDPMRFRDSDSSRWSWAAPGVRHPQWPQNYMNVIRATVDSGAVILCSTHAEVCAALCEAEIPFGLVYPSEDQRDDYIARMNGRGSSPKLITFIAGQWDELIASCQAQEGCEHVVLAPGQYLSEVVV